MKRKIENINDFFKDFMHIENIELNHVYFDLHLHTIDSDSNISPKELANFLKKKNYLIAITDHNSIGGIKPLEELGIKVVPGIEIGCHDGLEILAYFKTYEECEEFYNLYILPYRHKTRMARTTKDIWFFIEKLKLYNTYTSIPHISGMAQKNFLKNKEYIYDIIKVVDAIEIHNYGLSRKKNAIAKKIKNSYSLEGTYGSDAHSIKEVESFYKYLNKTHSTLHKSVDYIYKLNVISQIGYKHFKYMINKSFFIFLILFFTGCSFLFSRKTSSLEKKYNTLQVEFDTILSEPFDQKEISNLEEEYEELLADIKSLKEKKFAPKFGEEKLSLDQQKLLELQEKVQNKIIICEDLQK